MSYELLNLIKSSETSLTKMVNLLNESPSVCLSSLDPNQTALIIVDMVNGFVKMGPMSSPRIQTIIDPICDLLKRANDSQIDVVAFADCHQTDSIEFNSFPAHCIKGEVESEIIDEIKQYLFFCSTSQKTPMKIAPNNTSK